MYFPHFVTFVLHGRTVCICWALNTCLFIEIEHMNEHIIRNHFIRLLLTYLSRIIIKFCLLNNVLRLLTGQQEGHPTSEKPAAAMCLFEFFPTSVNYFCW